MDIGRVNVQRKLPKDLLTLVNKNRKKVDWLIALASYHEVTNDMGDTFPFLRAIGRKGFITFCRLSKFEIVLDNNFYKPETITDSNTEWVWGHISNPSSQTINRIQFAINYRGYVSKNLNLKFKVIHPTLNNCLFDVNQPNTTIHFSKLRSIFDRKVKLNPGMNLFEVIFHFNEVFVGSDARPISFGLADFHLSHREELQVSNELSIRKDLHSIGYENVFILRLGQSFSTYSKNFEGDPKDFWQKCSVKKTIGCRGLIVARSTGER